MGAGTGTNGGRASASTVTSYHRATTGDPGRTTDPRLAPVRAVAVGRRVVAVGRHLVARFRSVPLFVVYPQLFLGIGWLRAAAAHGLDPGWWSGEEVAEFSRRQMNDALPFYRPFLEHVVAAMPGITAVVVLASQLVIGVALVLNHRPWAFALGGALLNLQFILAGQVNPSVFYIVTAMTVVLWTMAVEVPARRSYDIAVRSTVLAVVVTVLCLPFARTLQPGSVIADPALVMVLLATLLAASTWIVHGRNSEVASLAPIDAHPSSASPNWYSVRCHFRIDEGSYEERITVWQAADFDEATALAEAEARRYAESIGGHYLKSCDCFRLTSWPVSAEPGFELYSLVRACDLDPETYLDTFFSTGGERSSTV